jgi:hypothetical protein
MSTILIHNVETGEIVERNKTAEELVQEEKDLQIAHETKMAKIEIETKRQAAEAKLAALGLTSDDLKALGL